MNKRTSTLSIAAVFAASVLALQSPIAGAQDNASDSSAQQGVPGVEMNVGENASDRGLPGVEMNVGAQGDQNNIDTRTMGLELAEQLGWRLPDVILYPTGGGTGLIGMWKAFDEMERLGWIGAPLAWLMGVFILVILLSFVPLPGGRPRRTS